MYSPKRIFESESIVVVFSEFDSAMIFATFNDAWQVAKGCEYSGRQLLEANRKSAVGFVTTKPNWFPPQDMRGAVAAAVEFIDHRPTITFGYDQGGYGALKFASALSAVAALSFSPQWSINPQDVSTFDRRVVRHYDPTVGNGEQIKPDELAIENYIFVDPLDFVDSAHAARLRALGRTQVIPVPFMGHRTLWQLLDAGSGNDLIHLSEGRLNSAELRNLVRRSRIRSREYGTRKLTKLADSIARHAGFYDAALQGVPESPYRTLALTYKEVARRHTDSAIALLASIPKDYLINQDIAKLCLFFRKFGFLEGEQRLLRLFSEKYPNDIHMRLFGIESMVTLGLIDDAVSELATIPMQGANPSQLARISAICRQINRLDLLSLASDRALENGIISVDQRIRSGFEIVEALRAEKTTTGLLRELRCIGKLCHGNDAALLRLIELAISISEFTVAEEILSSNPQLAESHPISRVYGAEIFAAQCKIRHETYKSKENLKLLLRTQINDMTFWLRLSKACFAHLTPRAALQALDTGISLQTGELPTEIHYERALLCAFCGKHRACRRELAILARGDAAKGHLAQGLVHLAMDEKQRHLALAFVDVWLNAHPPKTSSLAENLASCRLLIRALDLTRAATIIETVLEWLEDGGAAQQGQIAELIAHGQMIGFETEQRVMRLALDRFPGNKDFQALNASSRNELGERIFGVRRQASEPGGNPAAGAAARTSPQRTADPA